MDLVQRQMVAEVLARLGELAPQRVGAQVLDLGRIGVSEDALALAGVLARPWVDAALSGASTVEQLHSNLGALEVEWDEALEAELSTLVEPADEYWQTRSNLTWT